MPATLLVISIVLTIVAWALSKSYLEEKNRGKFEYQASDIHSAIDVRMSAYEQVLRSAVGFFNASDTVTRRDWNNFVKSLRLQEFYPGILGLGYTARLAPEEVDDFTRKIRAEGFPDFKVWPEEPREEYHSIVFLEPFEGRNLRAFGYDMYTQPKRKVAMERAGRTGLPALTEMLILVQETNKNVQRGCLLYLPVYDQTKSIATENERRAALKGFVYSPFRINDLMNGIMGDEAAEIAFDIYDGTRIDTANLFYASHEQTGPANNEAFTVLRRLEVAGHQWTLVFTSRQPLVSSYEANQPNIIATAGILVNLLLMFILLKVHSLSRRNMFLAERYKAEKDRYEIVSESTNDIIWEWDFSTDHVSFNKNYEQVLGYEVSGARLPYHAWLSHIHPADRDEWQIIYKA